MGPHIAQGALNEGLPHFRKIILTLILSKGHCLEACLTSADQFYLTNLHKPDSLKA
jgi:hypothetical protein